MEQEKDCDAEIHDLAFPELGDKPNHPMSFSFPKRKFGTKSRPIAPFSLHGSRSGHGLLTTKRMIKRFAFVCIKAVQQERVRNYALISKTSDAFLTRGFTNWKDATGEKHGGFPLHERSHVSFCCCSLNKMLV